MPPCPLIGGVMDTSKLDSHEKQNITVYRGVMVFMRNFVILIIVVLLLMALFLL